MIGKKKVIEEEEIDFEGTKLKFLLRLAMNRRIDNGEGMILSKLSIIMGVSALSPYFQDVIKYLVKNGVLIVVREVTAAIKIYKVDYNILKDLIDDQEETNYWFSYFDYYHYCFW